MRNNKNYCYSCKLKKNTPELREKLKSLGYKLNHGKWMGHYLVTFKTLDTNEWCFVGSPEYDLKNCPQYESLIDCGVNEDLFLAIAAINNDDDLNQYFVLEDSMGSVNYAESYFPKGTFMQSLSEKMLLPVKFHKASPQELFNYFNRNGMIFAKQ